MSSLPRFGSTRSEADSGTAGQVVDVTAGLERIAALVAVTAGDNADPVAGMLAVAGDLVPGTDWVSLSERRSGRKPRTTAVSHAAAAEWDALQFRAGRGPTCTALWKQYTIVVTDLPLDPRWPALHRLIDTSRPVRSVLSVPVSVRHSDAVTVSFYAQRAGVFADATLDIATLAVSALGTRLAGRAQQVRAENLASALESNRRIGVAVGVLMARGNTTEERAFALLSQTSQALNRKVVDVADDVVLTGALPVVPSTGIVPPGNRGR